jgi:hypothetical protein
MVYTQREPTLFKKKHPQKKHHIWHTKSCIPLDRSELLTSRPDSCQQSFFILQCKAGNLFLHMNNHTVMFQGLGHRT